MKKPKSKLMTLDYITIDVTEYKIGKVGNGCYIAFDFDPKDKARMRGVIVQDARCARDLERIFRRFAEELKEEVQQMSKAEVIAKTCHEVNRVYCQSIGDDTQVPWEEAPEWQKQSAIDGVVFWMHNSKLTPKDMHDNWMKGKLEAGWKYGPVKDPEKKEHHCLVPYNELPAVQQFKDKFFLAIVSTLA
jgi:hypothetical protein